MARLRSAISSVPVALAGWAMCAAALFAQTAAPTAFPPAPEGFDARRPGIPTGRVERIEYASRVTGGMRPAMVYTPAAIFPDRIATDGLPRFATVGAIARLVDHLRAQAER